MQVPTLFSQSDDVTVPVGVVAEFAADWTYPDGATRQRVIKRFAQTPGRYIVRLCPQADDLTTEYADAEVFWLLTVVPAS